jgi:hypothetical protein
MSLEVDFTQSNFKVMRDIKLTEGQLKSLKLFSYYIKSNGCSEVIGSVYFYDGGDYDSNDIGYWHCKDTYSTIDGYDAIDNIIKHIIYESEFSELLEEEYSSGSIEFVLDCNDKRLDVILYEQVNSNNELGNSYDVEEEDNEDLNKFFIEMRDKGLRDGSVTFDGGGDSGEIYSFLDTEDGLIRLPSGVENWLYNTLKNFYGGWEINEGSHGQFEFDFDGKEILLHFNEHAVDTISRGKIFETEF